MILKLMGILDLITAITLCLIPFGLISWKIVTLVIMYLLLKAYTFKGDLASILDGASAIYMFLILVGFPTILTPIFGIYLFQKAIFSLF